MLLVPLRHVLVERSHSGIVLSGMRCNGTMFEEHLDQRGTGMDLDRLTDQMMRDRVQMTFILNVVIDIDLGFSNIGVFIRMMRERLKCRAL
jgi:hypothetical protein